MKLNKDENMRSNQYFDIKSSKIGFTKAGIYLLVFCLGLMSSSFATGTNILFLLDFFLISILIFNYLYLRLLSKSKLKLEIPDIVFEDEFVNLKWCFQSYYPMKAKVTFQMNRFGEEKEFKSLFFFFNSEVLIESFFFPIRGLYEVSHIYLEIEFPFPLFVLHYESTFNQNIFVLPKAHESMTPTSFLDESKGLELEGFYQFKEYVTGDSMKRIAWKQYAKTNKLMVIEESPSKSSREIFSLNYEKENEKEYFSGVSSFFLNLLNNNHDFIIVGLQSQFISQNKKGLKEDLLKFLATYQRVKIQEKGNIKLVLK
ncbi:MAG: hypothetical protein COB02_16305 [Candidatus Cloacimonadota bacterium]|nr:MAG: hypothetical protein COB02_16305 [Candidatus Cloacimonadota bacterium]